MLRAILHTLGSRAVTMLLSLSLLLITTRWMGAENKGEITLLILNLSIVTILSGLFGGPSLVYLASRYRAAHLFILNYGWAIIISLMVTLVFLTTELPMNIGPLLFFIVALLESIVSMHTLYLLGRKRIVAHNILQVIKVSITVGYLIVLHINQAIDFSTFVEAYSLSLAITFILSTPLVLKAAEKTVISYSLQKTAIESLKYGFLVQTGNIAQLLNYRLSYYVLELLISPPTVALIRIGIFHAAVQIAEALWQFAKSMSTVQYATVSNETDNQRNLDLTLKITKVNYLVTGVGLLFLLLLPQDFYSSIFGQEFREIKQHLLILSIGILFLSISNAFSHYFSGIGNHRFNTYSSIFGLLLTCLLAYPMISNYGTLGAAAVASFVYTSQTIYQFWFLWKNDQVSISQLLISKKDLNFFYSRLPL